MVRLPYFDLVLTALNRQDTVVEQTFGRHTHWGYWADPAAATLTIEDFAQAADNLSWQVIEAAGIGPGMQVLDAGCGFGGTLGTINDSWQGMQLTGVNIDARQIERARALTAARPGNTLAFLTADACDLPLQSASVDAVVSVESIFHFPSRERFFAEASRVLKPGGRLALSDLVPSRYSPLRLTRRIQTGFFGVCQVQYAVRDYQQLAARHGFAVRTVRDITRNTLPTYRFLNRLLAQSGGLKVKLAGPLISLSAALLLLLITRLRLLNYYVLSFEKVAS